MTLKDAANRARKVLPTQYCGAVIVAAGSASRMGGIDKVMGPLRSFAPELPRSAPLCRAEAAARSR